MHQVNSAQRGFTLIELSIVLVIIGLIVGGVLVGQDLIRAAGVRATISQIEKYQTAANTFRGKYGYLPGDIKDPDASSFGFAARGVYAGEGDGNGIIEGSNNTAGGNTGLQWTGETDMFWVDLSKAGLIDGSFTTGTPTGTSPTDITDSTTPGVSAYLPPAKLGNGNYIYVWSQSQMNYYGLAGNVKLANPRYMESYPNLTVQQAYSIDKKMDDGLPQSGTVIAKYVYSDFTQGVWSDPSFHDAGPYTTAIAGSSSTCYDNGNTAGAVQQYSVEMSGGSNITCALSFQFQ